MAAPSQVADRAPGEGFLVMWTGTMSPAERDVQVVLRREGVRVEEVPLDQLVSQACQRAPDLLVVAGSVVTSPEALLSELAAASPSASVPLVTLEASENARPKPRSRFGQVAKLDREAGADVLARQVAMLLRGLSRRVPRWRVQAQLADVPGVARRSAVAGRSGLLAAAGAGAIAIDYDGVIGPDPKLFVASLAGVPELDLTLHERRPGSVRVLREEPRRPERTSDLSGVRILVMDTQIERARRLASEAERIGAHARSTGPVAQAVYANRAHDPMVVIAAADALLEPAASSIWEEPRFGSSAVLILDDRALELSVASISGLLARLAAPELDLAPRLLRGDAVADRLETLGAARWLKVLGRCEHDVTLRVFAAAGRGRVDLSEGKIQGAALRPSDPRAALIEGRAAVEALLRLPFGRVLAGPPGALAQLDGTRRARKPSVVGRIVPSQSSGVRELAAEEIVGAHVDTTRQKVAPPTALGGRTLAPRRERPRVTPREQTAARADTSAPATPAPSAADAARRARAEKPTAAETPTPEKRALPAPTPRGSESSRPGPAPSRSQGSSGPAPGAPVSSRVAPLSPPAPLGGGTPLPRAPAPAPLGFPLPPDPSEEGLPPALGDEPAPRGRREGEAKAQAAAAPARRATSGAQRSSGSRIWFGASLALALGVGGYAAWQLGLADPGAGASIARAPSADPAPRPPAERASDPPEADPAPVEPEAVEPEAADPAPADPEVTDLALADPPVVDPAVAALADPAPTDDPGEAVAEGAPPAAAPEPAPRPPPAPAREVRAAPSAPLPPAPRDANGITATLQMSSAAAREGDYARSAELARQVLAASPRNAPAAYRLAVALFRLRQGDEAMEWAERASEWNPDDPLPVSLQGDIHTRRGRFHFAVAAYRRALEIQPRFAPAQRQLERLRERGVGAE